MCVCVCTCVHVCAMWMLVEAMSEWVCVCICVCVCVCVVKCMHTTCVIKKTTKKHGDGVYNHKAKGFSKYNCIHSYAIQVTVVRREENPCWLSTFHVLTRRAWACVCGSADTLTHHTHCPSLGFATIKWVWWYCLNHVSTMTWTQAFFLQLVFVDM